jgi:hypothetical protein
MRTAQFVAAVSTLLAGPSVAEHVVVAQPIHLVGKANVEITDKAFAVDADSGVEACIVLDHCTNITISSCKFLDVPCEGIRLRQCHNVRILGNWFRGVGREKPRLAIDCYLSTDVRILRNRIQRVESGAYILESTRIMFASNYVEDVLGPMPRGQMIQFDKVFGEGNVICDNIAVNHWNRSHPEDVISIYKSTGTVSSPIIVRNNWIMGDPEVGSTDLSGSGSGIMLGDGGGGNILCAGNHLVSPGQVGIGVASGSNIVVASNVILGRRSNRSNVGIYVWNQYPQFAGKVRVASNTVAWANAQGQDSPMWQGEAKHGRAFEFTEVVIQDNVWNAWDAIGHTSTTPPTMDILSNAVPCEDTRPNQVPEDTARKLADPQH